MVGLLLAAPARAEAPRTLQEALAAAYANNPTLQTARAQLRATDENVPAALAGWRPQISVNVSAGRGFGSFTERTTNIFGQETTLTGSLRRNLFTEQGTLTQPVYTGGKTSANVHRAKNQVYAQRAQLLATEQQVLGNVVQAYVNVVQDERIVEIDAQIEQILARQLQSTNDRFRVGELTRTDVAQAEAALASATSQRQTAEGNLQTARAQYFQLVGFAPNNLSPPQPLKLPVATLNEAMAQAERNNPSVVAALFSVAAARDAFDAAYAALMPNISIQASGFRTQGTQTAGLNTTGGQVLAALTVPIYQGGSEYATIRQARQNEIAARKQLEDQRRTAIQQATSAWDQVLAARAAIDSNRAAVRAQTIAVEGLQREALVGSRTTQDVLIGIQSLLTAQTALVQSTAQLITASYTVAQAIGRLTARDLNLNVPYYDDTAYYNAVKDLWIGTGDYATNQPGR
jgi:outer membrane protein